MAIYIQPHILSSSNSNRAAFLYGMKDLGKEDAIKTMDIAELVEKDMA